MVLVPGGHKQIEKDGEAHGQEPSGPFSKGCCILNGCWLVNRECVIGSVLPAWTVTRYAVCIVEMYSVYV